MFADASRWAIDKMAKPEITGAMLDALDRCVGDPTAILDDYKAFDFFTEEKVRANTRKRATPRQHRLFTACSRLAEARARWATAFRCGFSRRRGATERTQASAQRPVV